MQPLAGHGPDAKVASVQAVERAGHAQTLNARLIDG